MMEFTMGRKLGRGHKVEGHEHFPDLYQSGLSTREIADKYGCSWATVNTHLNAAGVVRKAGVPRSRAHAAGQKYDLTEDYFEAIDTERKAYWLGFILADGNVHGNRLTIGLKASDAPHLETFLRDVGSSSSVILAKSSGYTDREQARVRVNSAKLVSDLAKWGILPKKSLTAHAPSLDPLLLRHFWRGVVDGDGHISKKGTRSPIVNLVGPVELCEQFKDWVGSLGNVSRNKVSSKPPHNGLCVVSFSRRALSHKILQELYGDSVVALPRKKQLALEWGFVPAPYIRNTVNKEVRND